MRCPARIPRRWAACGCRCRGWAGSSPRCLHACPRPGPARTAPACPSRLAPLGKHPPVYTNNWFFQGIIFDTMTRQSVSNEHKKRSMNDVINSFQCRCELVYETTLCCTKFHQSYRTSRVAHPSTRSGTSVRAPTRQGAARAPPPGRYYYLTAE